MNTEIIIAIICAVFASSGLWGLIQFLINRKDSIGEKIDKLTEMVKEVSDRVDHSSAISARARGRGRRNEITFVTTHQFNIL